MAIRGVVFFLASAIAIAAGCGSPGRAATDFQSGDSRGPAPSADTGEIVRWGEPGAAAPAGGTPPQRGILVAATRWGKTTFGVLDIAKAEIVSPATRETGGLVFARNRGRLAILLRHGPNPARNRIEILDWSGGKGFSVAPADDEAVLGFAFDSQGKQLTYAAMNLRQSRSAHVAWRLVILDLESRRARVLIDSNADKIRADGIPVPIAWSARTGRLYLQGLSPFRGMIRRGVWGLAVDSDEAQSVLGAPHYTGVPRLSPDGSRLAFLSLETVNLPSDFAAAPGPPPGNVLRVMDLTTGTETRWVRGAETAIGVFAWSGDGQEIVVADRSWRRGRFADGEIRRVGEGKTVSVAKIDSTRGVREVSSILDCRQQGLFWVEKERAAAKIYAGRGESSSPLFELADGSIELLGCLDP